MKKKQVNKLIFIAERRCKRIILVDEEQLASSCIIKREWTPIKVKDRAIYEELGCKFLRLILGIIKERDIEVTHFVDVNFNNKNYIVFLRKNKLSNNSKLVILHDNVFYHCS